MKYISVLIFVLLMAVTWSLSQTGATGNLQQHKQVEASFEEFIRTSVEKQIPNVKDIIFRQLFTETVHPGQEIKAFFRYDVIAPTQAGDTTAQTVEGSVVLKSQDQGQNWTIVSEKVSSPTLRFQEGAHISLKNSVDDAQDATVPAATHSDSSGATK